MMPLLLIILDGWGIGENNEHNAIARARTPFLDGLGETGAHSVLAASGEAVGLLPGQMGSSEVGHMHIGAGRVIRQELTRIHRAIADSSFFDVPALCSAADDAKRSDATLHLIGLLSDGGVHSHQQHLHALVELAKRRGVTRLAIHAILDGRDAPPQSALRYLNELSVHLHRVGIGTIATITGRFYAMDRNDHWERTQQAVAAMIQGIGNRGASLADIVTESQQRNVFDEFIEPTILSKELLIRPNDSIIFFNFRADRMRQLVQAISAAVRPLTIATMTPYGIETVEAVAAFPRPMADRHFSDVISRSGLRQLKIAEPQKYAHLTYFFNGTREQPYPNEDRIMIPSKNVRTFDATPELSAVEITNAAIQRLAEYPVVILNYANADMVGHTGNINAAIAACECIDQCLKRLVASATLQHYSVIITADHGNAELMFDPRNNIGHTAHTSNPVPLWLQSAQSTAIKPAGDLTNIAPLALKLLGLPKPSEMGESL